MWAQLIKVRFKPGKDLAVAAASLRAAEQPGLAWCTAAAEWILSSVPAA